jgi:hypothetical protein
MDLSSSNKTHFFFVCTNYGSTKDGIGHYTSKIVDELRKNSSLKITTYSVTTHHLSKLKLLFSMKMSLELLRLKRELQKKSDNSYIILEYPFVEYNPSFLLMLLSIKAKKNIKSKIVVSLHEYSRTKLFRKLFIRLLIPMSDVVLYTKDEDIKPFINDIIVFKRRLIPANIEPSNRKILKQTRELNICFFGIVNFETKEIRNMIEAWEMYLDMVLENKLTFHFISSSFHSDIQANNHLIYHFDLDDNEVSELLHKMQFMILPLKPKISTNNGSLSVCCLHECVPVGVFDDYYNKKELGLSMKNYSMQEFIRIYESINNTAFSRITEMAEVAYRHGKKMSIKNSAKSYLELLAL